MASLDKKKLKTKELENKVPKKHPPAEGFHPCGWKLSKRLTRLSCNLLNLFA
jgi:hypothetical protein